MAVQPDGKYVVAGTGEDQFALIRYNTDGSVDTAFGRYGKVTTSFNVGKCVATAVKVQSDGKIVMAGYILIDGISVVTDAFAVVRYNSDGSVDSSFSGDGKVITMIAGSTQQSVIRANGLAIQPDGKIVVVGSAKIGAHSDFALVRYNSDGSPDTSFSGDGQLTTAIGAGDDAANAVIIAFNKIIVAGSSSNGSDLDFAVARYNIDDGSPDLTFDTDGKVTTQPQFGTSEDIATALTIQLGNAATQPDRIVVTGSSSGVTNRDFAVVRYNLDGSLDNTFDTDGKVVTSIGTGDDAPAAVMVQSSGSILRKIIVAGMSTTSSGTRFAVVRYNTNGTLDTTFGGDGIATTAVGTNTYDVGTGAALLSGGVIVVAGSSLSLSTNSLDDFAIVRYNADGSLDTSFDLDGKRVDNVSDSGSSATGVAVQSDDKIVVVGSARSNFGLLRYNTDGSLDTSFDADGRVETDIRPSGFDEAHAVAIQPDGKIVTTGLSIKLPNEQVIAVTRHQPNGAPDLSFNGTGIVTADFGSGGTGNGVAIQPDGKIVVAGANSEDIVLLRLNVNGSPDSDFGVAGKVTTVIPGVQVGNAVALQSDGKIVVAGRSDGDFIIARYLPSGSPDTSLDGDGIVTTPIGTGADFAYGVAIQPDGKIVAAGFSDQSLAVARYLANGANDVSFNGFGKVTVPNASGRAVVVQADGRIVVAGLGYAPNSANVDVTVVRFEANGTLDNSYATNGRADLDVSGGARDTGAAVALDSAGRVVVAGESARSFAVARLQADPIAAPTPTPLPATLGNVSTRMRVETGDNALIGGFIITGTEPKRLIVRAIGPSVEVNGRLENPTLELNLPDGSVLTNDNWGDASNAQEIADSGIAPSHNLDSAILTTLPAGNSLYTAVVRGVDGGTGVGLIEAYDLDQQAKSQLANISSRGFVHGGDDVMIGGFFVVNGSRKVILRAIGPSLGISGQLEDPTLELFDSEGTPLASNNDWRDTQQAEIQATGIPPSDNHEAAIVRTLPASNYTAIVRGVNGGTGIGLVEVYALDQ